MKLKNRDKENTELLITTGFILIVIGFASIINITVSTLIISGIVIILIGAWRFLKKDRGRNKWKLKK